MFAPTRSGKGVGLVVPNLLAWPGSVLVHDIKGENWVLTAGWRSRELGCRCLHFDPTDVTGARYNPLLEIRTGEQDVRDAQNVAEILVDPNGDRIRDHWDRTAQALLIGASSTSSMPGTPEDARRRRALPRASRPPDRPEPRSAAGTEHAPPGILVGAIPHLRRRTHPTISSLAKELMDKSPKEGSGGLDGARLPRPLPRPDPGPQPRGVGLPPGGPHEPEQPCRST